MGFPALPSPDAEKHPGGIKDNRDESSIGAVYKMKKFNHMRKFVAF